MEFKTPQILDAGDKNGMPYLKIGSVGNFSVQKTFDCGQCFRFDPIASEHEIAFGGIAFGKHVIFAQDRAGEFYIYGATPDGLRSTWAHYLSLDVDYTAIDSSIVSALPPPSSEIMKKATDASSGIRILRQDKWETLCSFIISQNNNIPRIKKIIRALCEAYGDPVGDGEFAFPTPQALFDAGEAAIFALRTGFRAKYIVDCAEKVATGELDLDAVADLPYTDSAAELMKIKGVGPKVAACALLFGFGKSEAFPIDVWIKRIIAGRFPDGLDSSLFGKNAGIAQQYLFYYERYLMSAQTESK